MSFVLSWNSNFRERSPGRLLLLMILGILQLEFQLLLLLCYLECIYIGVFYEKQQGLDENCTMGEGQMQPY